MTPNQLMEQIERRRADRGGKPREVHLHPDAVDELEQTGAVTAQQQAKARQGYRCTFMGVPVYANDSIPRELAHFVDTSRGSVVVFGDPFTVGDPFTAPGRRRARAIATVNNAIERGQLAVERGQLAVDPTEAQQLSAAPELSAAELEQQLSEKMTERLSAALGTPTRVLVVRDICRRSWGVTSRCNNCGEGMATSVDYDVYDDAEHLGISIQLRVEVIESFTKLGRQTPDERVCRCVDGLTPAQCLTKWTNNTRENAQGYPTAAAWSSGWQFNELEIQRAFLKLTARQIEAARTEWSRALREKVKASDEKERNQVLVDIQDLD